MLCWLKPKTAVALATGPTARKTAVAVVDQGILSATNFFTGLMLARLCSKEEFGAYALAFSVMLAANGLQTALVTGPMTVLGAGREGDDWRGYATSMALAQLVLGGALAVLSAAVCGTLAALGALKGPLAGAFLAMSGALFFIQAREFCRRALYTRLRAWRVLLNDVCYSGLQIGGLLALWKLGGGSWGRGGHEATAGFLSGKSAFLCMGASVTAGSLLGLWQIRRSLTGGPTRRRGHLRETWNFAKWSLGSLAGSVLTIQATTWVIGGIAGIAAVGMVTAARLLVAPLQLIIFGGPNVLVPRAARAYGQGGREMLLTFVRRLAPVWLVIFVGYGVLVGMAPQFWLNLLFGGKYSGATFIVILWVAAYVAVGVGQLPAMVVSAMRRPDAAMIVGLVAGAASVLITAACTAWGGAEWAVAGRVVGATLATVSLVEWVRRNLLCSRASPQ